ncbi:MAG: exonuclease SbcCD subunit D [Leucothrix sp.]
MRILHTSDWHIGRQFYNVSLLEDQRYVLDQIVEIAQSEAVDVVLIAGDVYDRAIPPANAVSLVDDVLNRLVNELGIPVIMIAGNHDGPQRLGFASRQLAEAKLYIAGPLIAELQPITLTDEHGEVVFYPIPYADPATVRDVFADDKVRTHEQAMERIMGALPEHKIQRSVALSHCFLVGGSDCDSERPLSVGGADHVTRQHFADFNYVAMGHLHRQQHQGSEVIRYSGSPLKYSFSEEQHEKSITIVDLDAEGDCDIKHIPLVALRDIRSISGALDDIIQAAGQDDNAEDYLLISLTDTHAILDPIGKLRAVYPNVLHLERPGLMSAKPQQLAHRDLMKKGELSMFKDFYKQTLNEDISEAQMQIVDELLNEIHADQGA